jgi:uncharacterized protein (TIGR02246 family)
MRIGSGTDAMNAGDLDAVMALYEPDATFLTGAGETGTGAAARRANLSRILGLKPHFAMAVRSVVQTGDLALLVSPWTVTLTGPDGTRQSTGTTADVVRRQPDGSWRFVISYNVGSG